MIDKIDFYYILKSFKIDFERNIYNKDISYNCEEQ